jgi:hypothetical protein
MDLVVRVREIKGECPIFSADDAFLSRRNRDIRDQEELNLDHEEEK